MSDYMEETGDPFTGKKKEELKKFLEYMGLTYDEQITHSIVLRKEKEIIATASCQKNIIKCVAVSEAYQGQNLLAHLMTSLIEYFYGMGISHFFGFTKPQNKELFCSMGMYPVAQTEKILLLENDKNGLEKFLKRLKKETQEQQKCKVENRHENGIGAVVMNCNPFTRGHEYLIREAAKKKKKAAHFYPLKRTELSDNERTVSVGKRRNTGNSKCDSSPDLRIHDFAGCVSDILYQRKSESL